MIIIKSAIIFDLDGTLWDSSQQVTDAWNQVLAKHTDLREPITLDDMHSYMGLIMDDIFKKMLPDADKSTRLAVQKECERHENEYLCTNSGTVYPNVKATLSELKKAGYYLYIVSNCNDGYIEAFLQSSGLAELFDGFEMFGRTGLEKCDNIKLVVNREHIDKAVYVGDTLGDYNSTVNAGLPFIHSSYGFGAVKDAAYKINSFDELCALVSTIL